MNCRQWPYKNGQWNGPEPKCKLFFMTPSRCSPLCCLVNAKWPRPLSAFFPILIYYPDTHTYMYKKVCGWKGYGIWHSHVVQVHNKSPWTIFTTWPWFDPSPNGTCVSKSCKYISYQLYNGAWQSMKHLVREIFQAGTLISSPIAVEK